MGEKKGLSRRRRRFVEEYLRCGDPAEAAEAAGYSPGTAAVRGRALLREPEVRRYRRELEQKLFDEMGISQAWIGRRLVEIVERCMQATPHMSRNPETRTREPDGTWEFDPGGAMRALHELDEHLRNLQREEDEEERQSFEDWLLSQGQSKL